MTTDRPDEADARQKERKAASRFAAALRARKADAKAGASPPAKEEAAPAAGKEPAPKAAVPPQPRQATQASDTSAKPGQTAGPAPHPAASGSIPAGGAPPTKSPSTAPSAGAPSTPSPSAAAPSTPSTPKAAASTASPSTTAASSGPKPAASPAATPATPGPATAKEAQGTPKSATLSDSGFAPMPDQPKAQAGAAKEGEAKPASPPRPSGPTRDAQPTPGQLGGSKAAAGTPVRTMGSDAGGAIHAAAVKDAVTPTAKVPEFPPPAGERLWELQVEEARRASIRAKEEMRRAKEIERLTALEDPIAIRKLQAQWAADDALEYHTDPDDEEMEVYPVNAPYAYVQIIRNKRTHDIIYHVIEPKLTREERLLLDFVESTMVDVLDLQPEELDKEDLADYIRKKFDLVAEDYSLRLGDEDSTPEESRDRLLYYVLRDFMGEGPIDVFVHDPMLEDISCDGPHQPMFIYHRKYESVTTTVRFRDHAHLDSFVIRLAQRAGKHVSIAEPILDATMRDGSRLQATLAKEVSTFGSTFTIRKFRDVPFSPVDLVRFGTMSSQMLAYLWMVIANRQSGIYSGGTASGKTTAINAIMLFIPPSMKVITIEDTRELSIPQPNWIAGLTRGGFGPRDNQGRQAGEIDMFQLLKNALRQRPEYIIVGEVRGAEAYNLFQAMATGHAAYGTMHADSVDAVIHRLESDPINIPRSLLEALDVVAVQVQTRVGGKRVRRTKQITEIVGLDPNTREILTNEVFRWEPSTDQFIFSGVSYSLERIAAETGTNLQEVMKELDDRRKVIEWMVEQEIREYRTVAHIIQIYFHDKEKVMVRVKGGFPWQD